MANKDEKLRQLDGDAAQYAEQADATEEGPESVVSEKDDRPAEKRPKAAPDKKAKKKDGKPNIFKRIAKWFKDTFNELKKVTWPTFPKTMKQTGVVLGVVLFFLILLFGFDLGLKQLYNLLFTNIAA